MDARKTRYAAGDLAALFRGGRTLVVAKGRTHVTVDLARARPEDLELALGPTGNLRAPAARRGADWLVGFDAALWAAFLA